MTELKNETEARQGENSRRMPFVLGASVVLVLLGFAGFYGFEQMAAPQQDTHSPSNSAGK